MTKDSPGIFAILENNSIDELESILSNDPSAANAINEQGISLLLMAVYMGNQKAINTIRKFKPVLSPWEAACTGEKKQLEDLLKTYPTLIDDISPDGFSLLGYACFFRQKPIAEMLINNGADVNKPSQNAMKVAPLHSASAVSDYDLCQLLLEHGANVNAIQHGGYTALHAAAQNGKTELAQLLLNHGADKNILTDKGESAAMLAREKQHGATADFIVAYN